MSSRSQSRSVSSFVESRSAGSRSRRKTRPALRNFVILQQQPLKIVSDHITGRSFAQAAKKGVRALKVPLHQTRIIYVLRKEGTGNDFRVKVGCYKIWKTKTRNGFAVDLGSRKLRLKHKSHSEAIFVPFYVSGVRRNSLVADLKAVRELRIKFNGAMRKRHSQH